MPRTKQLHHESNGESTVDVVVVEGSSQKDAKYAGILVLKPNRGFHDE